jgi:hypothetical protein
MALGPPVCEKCMVIYEFKHSYGWECPVCKTNSESKLGLWDMQHDELTLEELTEQLKSNRNFYDFVAGKDNDDVSSSNA